MKSFILLISSISSISSISFLAILQPSFAQKYEYDIAGVHFSDTLQKMRTHITPLVKNPIQDIEREAIFEMPTDTTYIYHQVGQGERIEYILGLYQICTPCFAKWNNLNYPNFSEFLKQTFYEGEYLKVAVKKEYEKGMPSEYKTRTLYQNFSEQTYIYEIARQYQISESDFKLWNNLGEYAYYIEDVRLIVGKTEYKYACPCK